MQAIAAGEFAANAATKDGRKRKAGMCLDDAEPLQVVSNPEGNAVQCYDDAEGVILHNTHDTPAQAPSDSAHVQLSTMQEQSGSVIRDSFKAASACGMMSQNSTDVRIGREMHSCGGTYTCGDLSVSQDLLYTSLTQHLVMPDSATPSNVQGLSCDVNETWTFDRTAEFLNAPQQMQQGQMQQDCSLQLGSSRQQQVTSGWQQHQHEQQQQAGNVVLGVSSRVHSIGHHPRPRVNAQSAQQGSVSHGLSGIQCAPGNEAAEWLF